MQLRVRLSLVAGSPRPVYYYLLASRSPERDYAKKKYTEKKKYMVK